MNFDRMLVADVLRTRTDAAVTLKFIAVGSAANHIVTTFIDASENTSRTSQTDQLGIEKYLHVDGDTNSKLSIERFAISPFLTDGDDPATTYSLFHDITHTKQCRLSLSRDSNRYPGHSRSCAIDHFYQKHFDRWIEDSIQVTHVDQSQTIIPLLLIQVDSIAAAAIPQILRSLRSANDKNRNHRAVVTLPLVMLVIDFTGNENANIPSLINALVTQAEILTLANQQTNRTVPLEAQSPNQSFGESCFLMPGQSVLGDSTYVKFFNSILSDTTSLKEFLTALTESKRNPARPEIAAASLPCVEISPTGSVQVLGIDDADTPFELIQQELLNREGTNLSYSENIDLELQSLRWLGESMVTALPMRDNYIHDALRGSLISLIKSHENREHLRSEELEQFLEVLRINLLRSMVVYGTYGFRESEAFEWMTSLDIERCEVWRDRSQQTTDVEFTLMCATREGLLVSKGLADLEQSIRYRHFTSGDVTTKAELLRELRELVEPRESSR